MGLGLHHVTESALAQRFAERQILAREFPFRVQRQLVLRQRSDIGAQPRAVLLNLDDGKQL